MDICPHLCGMAINRRQCGAKRLTCIQMSCVELFFKILNWAVSCHFTRISWNVQAKRHFDHFLELDYLWELNENVNYNCNQSFFKHSFPFCNLFPCDEAISKENADEYFRAITFNLLKNKKKRKPFGIRRYFGNGCFSVLFLFFFDGKVVRVIAIRSTCVTCVTQTSKNRNGCNSIERVTWDSKNVSSRNEKENTNCYRSMRTLTFRNQKNKFESVNFNLASFGGRPELKCSFNHPPLGQTPLCSARFLAWIL